MCTTVVHLVAQSGRTFGAGCDTVFSVRWGTGQTFGREFFPRNVLGLPDTNARSNIPSANPREICSLGMGGEIVIGWRQAVLVNRPGVDFTVFENAFIRFDGRVFAEPAKVAVSRDGTSFVEFPYDSLTLRGCAGVTPTHGQYSPFDPMLSGGDSFDLAVLGIDSVRYIKITDISALVLNNPRHMFYDPTISGFDLDAVVGLHLLADARVTSVRAHADASAVVQRYAEVVVVSRSTYQQEHAVWKVQLYSLLGQRVAEAESTTNI
ncbi:MAG: hypothetical protein NZ661_12085, partial [Candidatus Kapabacteria bacterium]|nr:hypothetical protein [Candidatus Kapabacteria bacterium]